MNPYQGLKLNRVERRQSQFDVTMPMNPYQGLKQK